MIVLRFPPVNCARVVGIDHCSPVVDIVNTLLVAFVPNATHLESAYIMPVGIPPLNAVNVESIHVARLSVDTLIKADVFPTSRDRMTHFDPSYAIP